MAPEMGVWRVDGQMPVTLAALGLALVSRPEVGPGRSRHLVRYVSATVAALAFLSVAGCASDSPYGVDPPLREAANHFSVALSNGDGKVLAQMNGAKDEGRLASLLASYGGRPTVPVAYDSEDRGIANVEFAVKCSSGGQTIHQRFIYISGARRPDLGADQAPIEGSIPSASVPTSIIPSAAPQPVCS